VQALFNIWLLYLCHFLHCSNNRTQVATVTVATSRIVPSTDRSLVLARLRPRCIPSSGHVNLPPPQWHLDWFSRFCWDHAITDTHRPTHRPSTVSTSVATACMYALSACNAGEKYNKEGSAKEWKQAVGYKASD